MLLYCRGILVPQKRKKLNTVLKTAPGEHLWHSPKNSIPKYQKVWSRKYIMWSESTGYFFENMLAFHTATVTSF